MNDLPELQTTRPDRVVEPLAGGYVGSAPLPGKSDLSDWVGLMEVVEALCSVWTERGGGGAAAIRRVGLPASVARQAEVDRHRACRSQEAAAGRRQSVYIARIDRECQGAGRSG